MIRLDLTGCHILVLEDEYLIAQALAGLLQAWGATIIGPVPTAERALDLLVKTPRIDFAVVDINLRGVPSFAVADSLFSRGIPFAFTTGYGSSTIPERYRSIAILQKPFVEAHFEEVLSPLSC